MDIELAVDAMEIAGSIDHMVLFSGDGPLAGRGRAAARRAVVDDRPSRPWWPTCGVFDRGGRIGRDPAERAARGRVSRASATRRNSCTVRGAAAGAGAGAVDDDDSKLTTRPASPAATARSVRLKAFREDWRQREPAWFNAPVASLGPRSARLLIVDATRPQGANRTGRPFTGDYAGDLLYDTLKHFGFARGSYEARPDDGLILVDARITNAVRCVPPENKPSPAEIKTCRAFLEATIAEMPNLRAIVTLGRIARQHGGGAAPPPPGSAVRPCHVARRRCFADLRELSLLTLQHQQGVLTPKMFRVCRARRGLFWTRANASEACPRYALASQAITSSAFLSGTPDRTPVMAPSSMTRPCV